jgi:hypothetical protein
MLACSRACLRFERDGKRRGCTWSRRRTQVRAGRLTRNAQDIVRCAARSDATGASSPHEALARGSMPFVDFTRLARRSLMRRRDEEALRINVISAGRCVP